MEDAASPFELFGHALVGLHRRAAGEEAVVGVERVRQSGHGLVGALERRVVRLLDVEVMNLIGRLHVDAQGRDLRASGLCAGYALVESGLHGRGILGRDAVREWYPGGIARSG